MYISWKWRFAGLANWYLSFVELTWNNLTQLSVGIFLGCWIVGSSTTCSECSPHGLGLDFASCLLHGGRYLVYIQFVFYKFFTCLRNPLGSVVVRQTWTATKTSPFFLTLCGDNAQMRARDVVTEYNQNARYGYCTFQWSFTQLVILKLNLASEQDKVF